MHDAISPYALLHASKPSAMPVQTAYDLYSQAQQQSMPDISRNNTPPVPLPRPEEKASDAAHPPAKRTHYIAGIQSRHNAAIRKTPMNLHPMG